MSKDGVNRKAEITSNCYLPLWKFLDIVHPATTVVQLEVICGGSEAYEDKVKDFYLTKDAFKDFMYGKEDTEYCRLMKYYADVPIWNVVAGTEFYYIYGHNEVVNGCVNKPVILAHIHYKDIRDAYAREREDIRKAKRKAYRERKKEEKNEH